MFLHVFPIDVIYWVILTKISVCEGCEGCTVRKSGPDWRLVCGWVCPPVCTGPARSVSEVHKLSEPVGSFSKLHKLSQLHIGSKSPKFSRRFAPKLLLRTLQKRIKIAKFSRRFAPKSLLRTLQKRIKIAKKTSRRFAPKLLLRTLQKRIKIAKFSRRFAPKCLYGTHLWVSRPN